jgi:hypothetical protein
MLQTATQTELIITEEYAVELTKTGAASSQKSKTLTIQ